MDKLTQGKDNLVYFYFSTINLISTVTNIYRYRQYQLTITKKETTFKVVSYNVVVRLFLYTLMLYAL